MKLGLFCLCINSCAPMEPSDKPGIIIGILCLATQCNREVSSSIRSPIAQHSSTDPNPNHGFSGFSSILSFSISSNQGRTLFSRISP